MIDREIEKRIAEDFSTMAKFRKRGWDLEHHRQGTRRASLIVCCIAANPWIIYTLNASPPLSALAMKVCSLYEEWSYTYRCHVLRDGRRILFSRPRSTVPQRRLQAWTKTYWHLPRQLETDCRRLCSGWYHSEIIDVGRVIRRDPSSRWRTEMNTSRQDQRTQSFSPHSNVVYRKQRLLCQYRLVEPLLTRLISTDLVTTIILRDRQMPKKWRKKILYLNCIFQFYFTIIRYRPEKWHYLYKNERINTISS